MTDDLIKRSNALVACMLREDNVLTDMQISLRNVISALPAVKDARIKELEHERDGIREAAWMEALDAAHQYTLMQYGLAFLKDPVDRARIIDMIGQRE